MRGPSGDHVGEVRAQRLKLPRTDSSVVGELWLYPLAGLGLCLFGQGGAAKGDVVAGDDVVLGLCAKDGKLLGATERGQREDHTDREGDCEDANSPGCEVGRSGHGHSAWTGAVRASLQHLPARVQAEFIIHTR